MEENAGFIPGYPGYSWRGKVVALDANTGRPAWKQPFVTIDDASYNRGLYRRSVWGSTPVVDTSPGSALCQHGQQLLRTGTATPVLEAKSARRRPLRFRPGTGLNTGKLIWAFRAWNGDKWDVASWVSPGSPPTRVAIWRSARTGTSAPARISSAQVGERQCGRGREKRHLLFARSGYGTRQLADTGRTGRHRRRIEWGSAVDGTTRLLRHFKLR